MRTETRVHDYVCGRIRALRERRGWTAAEFARILELPRTSYVSMENGAYNMKLEFVHRALEALQVDIEEIWPPRQARGSRKRY